MNQSVEALSGFAEAVLGMQVSPWQTGALARAVRADLSVIEHNNWRYGELLKLRRGQSNQYEQSRYR